MGCPTCQTPTASKCSESTSSSCVTTDTSECPQVINNSFHTAICTNYAFNMPICGSDVLTFIVKVENAPVPIIPVGAYLWSALTGYLEVILFDSKTGQITLRNNCPEGNASPGAFIPAATCFITIVTPFGFGSSSVISSDISDFAFGTLAVSPVTTDPITLIFINSTPIFIMNVKIRVNVDMPYNYMGLQADNVVLTLKRQVNGGGYIDSVVRHVTIGEGTASGGQMNEQLNFIEIILVPPGNTLTVNYKAVAAEELAGAGGIVDGMSISANGLGVAV